MKCITLILTAANIIAATHLFTLNGAAASGDVDPAFNPIPSNAASSVSGNLTIQPAGKIIIYGNFQIVQGVPKSGIARLNADGSLDNSFDCTACDFTISSAVVQSDGKIVVGGHKGLDFSIQRMRRLNSDGSIDASFATPFDEQPPGAVSRSITVWAVQPDGKIFASQSSCCVGGFQKSLYRLNPTGNIDSAFTSLFFAGNSEHYLFDLKLLPDGKLMIGGKHTFGYIFRVNTDGTKDTSFESPALTHSISQISPVVSSFEIQADGKIPFVGVFDSVNGVDKSDVARLNADQSVDSLYTFPLTFAFGESTPARKVLLQSDGKLLVSGAFTNGQRLVRLNIDGTIDNTFNAPSNIISFGSWTLDANEGVLIFADFQGEGRKFVRLNNDGSLDVTFDVTFGTAAAIYSTAVQADGRVIISGSFTEMNNSSRTRIARVNADGTLDTSFDPGTGFDVPPTKLVLQTDGKTLAIGGFTTYDGTPRTGFARLNADGSLDNSFNPTVQDVNAVAVQADGKILIGGAFTSVNGTTRTGIARLNADGSLDVSFNTTLGSPSVQAILVQEDGKIMIGGSFTGVNGFNRTNMARLSADGTLDTTFDAGSVGSLKILSRQTDGKYLAANGGSVFRRNADGTVDTSFHTVTFNSSINAVLLQADDTIVVGGSFTTVNSIARPYLVRLRTNGSLDSTFPACDPNGQVRSLSKQVDNKIIVGGDFTVIGGVGRLGIARLNYSPAVSTTLFDFDGDGRADVSVFRPSTNRWYELRSSDSQVEETTFGAADDVPVPADFDGDGKTDEAIFRPSTGTWWYQGSISGMHIATQFGQAGDVPRPSDFDGDGKADLIVYRLSNSVWYRAGTTGELSIIQFGIAEDKPVIGDFDGDGRSDLAVYRPSTGTWWYAASGSPGQFQAVQFGISSDIPAAADYDGDGRTDLAVYRPSEGLWYILNSSNGSVAIAAFGVAEDRPVPADYDGDGRADIAVFRPSTGIWYLPRSTSGFTAYQFGVGTDVAVQSAYIP